MPPPASIAVWGASSSSSTFHTPPSIVLSSAPTVKLVVTSFRILATPITMPRPMCPIVVPSVIVVTPVCPTARKSRATIFVTLAPIIFAPVATALGRPSRWRAIVCICITCATDV
eukprot:scaffold186207_cov28-Tisochrysis_lutea.AAC.3